MNKKTSQPERSHQAARLLQQGRTVEAEEHCRRTLQQHPNDSSALSTLATIASLGGRIEEACGLFARLAKVVPRDATVHVNLGRVMLAAGDAQAAIASLERALAIEPDMPAALATLADARNRAGQPQQALELLQPHVASGREDAAMALQAATILDQMRDHERAAATAERHFERDATIDPLLRRQLGFVLGRSLDALDQPERAFRAYSRANAQLASAPGAPRFDPEAFVRSIDELIAFFTPQRLRALPRATVRSPLPVFVTGAPRSGTTLIEQIIHAHPAGFGAGELLHLDAIVESLQPRLHAPAAWPQALMSLRQESADEIAREHLQRLTDLAATKARLAGSSPVQRIVDKNLRNVMHLGLIWLLFPQAGVILCRRDPLATGFSCFTNALSPFRHPWALDLSHIAVFLRQVDRLIEHWRLALDWPMLDVQYERLVREQEHVSRTIITHVGLEWDDRCLRFHEASRIVRTLSYDQVRRPMYADALERHRRYEQFLGPLKPALGPGVNGGW